MKNFWASWPKKDLQGLQGAFKVASSASPGGFLLEEESMRDRLQEGFKPFSRGLQESFDQGCKVKGLKAGRGLRQASRGFKPGPNCDPQTRFDYSQFGAPGNTRQQNLLKTTVDGQHIRS